MPAPRLSRLNESKIKREPLAFAFFSDRDAPLTLAPSRGGITERGCVGAAIAGTSFHDCRGAPDASIVRGVWVVGMIKEG